MKRKMLDTNIVSYYLRGIPEVGPPMINYFRHFGEWDITIITYYELLKGLHNHSTPKEWENLEAFLAYCSIHHLDIGAAEEAARIGGHLIRTGQKIGNADVLIAGITGSLQWPLVTNNEKHFSRISGLQLENWTK